MHSKGDADAKDASSRSEGTTREGVDAGFNPVYDRRPPREEGWSEETERFKQLLDDRGDMRIGQLILNALRYNYDLDDAEDDVRILFNIEAPDLVDVVEAFYGKLYDNDVGGDREDREYISLEEVEEKYGIDGDGVADSASDRRAGSESHSDLPKELSDATQSDADAEHEERFEPECRRCGKSREAAESVHPFHQGRHFFGPEWCCGDCLDERDGGGG